MAGELGTATLELLADVGPFNRGIDQAKRSVAGLGSEVQAIGPRFASQQISMNQMLANFQRGQYGAAAATKNTAAALEQQTLRMSQLVSVARGNPLSALAGAFAGTNINISAMLPLLKGAAVGMVAVYGASKFLQFMEAHSASTKVAVGELSAETNVLADRMAGDLAPAVDAGVHALTALAKALDDAYGGVTSLGDAVEAKFGQGGKGAMLGALLGIPFGPLGIPLGAGIGGGVGLAIEKFGDDTDDVATATHHWYGNLLDVMRTYEGIARSKANTEQGPRGGQTMGSLPTVYGGSTAPVEWINNVKGAYNSIAEYVQAKMTDALYPPTGAANAVQSQVDEIEVQLRRFEVNRREGGLTGNEKDIRQALMDKLRGLIGPQDAAAFAKSLIGDTSLIGGELGKLLFEQWTKARDFARDAMLTKTATNNPFGELFKVGSANTPLTTTEFMTPGLKDAIDGVDTLTRGLDALPTSKTITINVRIPGLPVIPGDPSEQPRGSGGGRSAGLGAGLSRLIDDHNRRRNR